MNHTEALNVEDSNYAIYLLRRQETSLRDRISRTEIELVALAQSDAGRRADLKQTRADLDDVVAALAILDPEGGVA